MYKFIIVIMLCACPAWADTFITEASYYTRASCLAESGQCVMANGKELRDENLTVASWDYPFGTRLKISAVGSGRSVVCEVTDRGPSKRLYRKGRKIDLSRAAMEALGGQWAINKGLLKVIVEVI